MGVWGQSPLPEKDPHHLEAVRCRSLLIPLFTREHKIRGEKACDCPEDQGEISNKDWAWIQQAVAGAQTLSLGRSMPLIHICVGHIIILVLNQIAIDLPK
jgi:hypothetical protein